MAASLWLSWQESVSLSSSDNQTIVAGPDARIALRSLAPEIVAAMERLAPPGEDEDRLEESILAAGDVDSLARWYYHVDQLRQRGLVCRSLRADGRLMASLVPLCRSLAALSRDVSTVFAPATRNHRYRPGRSSDLNGAAGTLYVLSRFALLRREGHELVLESPLAHARVILHDARAIAVIGALAVPASANDLAGRLTEIASGTISAFITLLVEAGMVDQVSSDATRSQSECPRSESSRSGSARAESTRGENPALESWEFHDLLFHARSRRGRSAGQFGGTYRLAHRPPPPALKATAATEWHDLHRPDLERLECDDPPLAQVQERRRSLRQYGTEPITSRQLGEFLYRVGRVKRYWQAEAAAPSGPITMDFTERPYPAGGGLYELEFYTVIGACQDLAPGLCHYDPQQHRLDRVCGATRDVDLLLQDAAASAGIARETLQVLVILTARFQRLAWKYESIAYSLMLKDVGVVYQTMYLAATAMGLAPCALGCGDSDLFARTAGTDYYAETSVGEFLLGSKE